MGSVFIGERCFMMSGKVAEVIGYFYSEARFHGEFVI